MSKAEELTPANHRTRVGQQRRARTQARIIQAALHVFAEKGPDAAVIDDFIRAAAVARGTFYNYFKSVDELLEATSRWLIDGSIAWIEVALGAREDPAERFGLGVRLFMGKAQSDPVWCRFIVRTWAVGELEYPLRDIRQGVQQKLFHTPSIEAARDLQMGTLREAMLRIISGQVPVGYAEQIAAICMQGLGLERQRIAQIMALPLPPLPRSTGAPA